MPDASGLTVNVPLPPGATGDVARAAIDDGRRPGGRDASRPRGCWCRPDSTPTAPTRSPTSSGLPATTRRSRPRVSAFTPQRGRLLAFLEGGYDLDALRECVRVTATALAGGTTDTEAPSEGGPGRDAVARTSHIIVSLQ